MSLLGTVDLDKPIQQTDGNRQTVASLKIMASQAAQTGQIRISGFGSSGANNQNNPTTARNTPDSSSNTETIHEAHADNLMSLVRNRQMDVGGITLQQKRALNADDRAELEDLQQQQHKQPSAPDDDDDDDPDQKNKHVLLEGLAATGGAVAASAITYDLWSHRRGLIRRLVGALRRTIKKWGKQGEKWAEETRVRRLKRENDLAKARAEEAKRGAAEAKEHHESTRGRAINESAPEEIKAAERAALEAEKKATQAAAAQAARLAELRTAEAAKATEKLGAATKSLATVSRELNDMRRMDLLKAPVRWSGLLIPGTIAAGIVIYMRGKNEKPGVTAQKATNAFNNWNFGPDAVKAAKEGGFWAGAKQFGMDMANGLKGVYEFGKLWKHDPQAAYKEIHDKGQELLKIGDDVAQVVHDHPEAARDLAEGSLTAAEAAAADPKLAGAVADTVAQGPKAAISSATAMDAAQAAASNPAVMAGVNTATRSYNTLHNDLATTTNPGVKPAPNGDGARKHVVNATAPEENHPNAS